MHGDSTTAGTPAHRVLLPSQLQPTPPDRDMSGTATTRPAGSKTPRLPLPAWLPLPQAGSISGCLANRFPWGDYARTDARLSTPTAAHGERVKLSVSVVGWRLDDRERGKVRENSLSGHFPFSGAFLRVFLRFRPFRLTGRIGWNPLICKSFSGGGGENRTR